MHLMIFKDWALHDSADGAQVVLAIVQIFLIPFVIVQVLELQKNLRSTAHSNIYGRYADTIHWLLDKPHLQPYFRDNVRLADSKPTEGTAAQVQALCELTTALFEHATLERHNMPSTSWRDCWMPYITASYERSAEMRLFFQEKTNQFYVSEYRDLIAGEVAPKIKPRWMISKKAP